MKDLIFKIVGQKSSNGKIVLMAVVPEDFLGVEIPDIFEMVAVKSAPTIYTGASPSIQIDTLNIENVTEERAGSGLASLALKTEWFNQEVEKEDILGISL